LVVVGIVMGVLLGGAGQGRAEDVEVFLGSSDGSSAFVIYDANSNVLFRISSDGTLQQTPGTVPEGMVYVPGGMFVMGNSRGGGYQYEHTNHVVKLNSFYMEKYEVTKGLWDDVYSWASTNGYGFDNAGSSTNANHPVHSVSWYDCVKWCNARSEKAGLTPAYYTNAELTVVYRTSQSIPLVKRWSGGYRLPTEAEWEYAARGAAAGRNTKYSGSDAVDGVAWYAGNSGGHAHEVGTKAPNRLGLHDMSGSVLEWCNDWWQDYYSGEVQVDPSGPDSGTSRVMRGGHWNDSAIGCRVSSRTLHPPSGSLTVLGLRCVR